MIKEQPTVIFDGTCGLCNRFVLFSLRRKGRQSMAFVSRNSKRGKQMLDLRSLNDVARGTVIVLNQDEILLRSEAALFVLSRLRFPYSLCALLRVVPRFLRDYVYDLVARNRLRFFGEVSECALIPEELQAGVFNEEEK